MEKKFAPEILQHISHFLREKKSISALSRTCVTLAKTVQCSLFNALKITENLGDGDLILEHNPILGTFVKDLEISDPAGVANPHLLGHILRHFTGVRRVRLCIDWVPDNPDTLMLEAALIYLVTRPTINSIHIEDSYHIPIVKMMNFAHHHSRHLPATVHLVACDFLIESPNLQGFPPVQLEKETLSSKFSGSRWSPTTLSVFEFFWDDLPRYICMKYVHTLTMEYPPLRLSDFQAEAFPNLRVVKLYVDDYQPGSWKSLRSSESGFNLDSYTIMMMAVNIPWADIAKDIPLFLQNVATHSFTVKIVAPQFNIHFDIDRGGRSLHDTVASFCAPSPRSFTFGLSIPYPVAWQNGISHPWESGQFYAWIDEKEDRIRHLIHAGADLPDIEVNTGIFWEPPYPEMSWDAATSPNPNPRISWDLLPPPIDRGSYISPPWFEFVLERDQGEPSLPFIYP